MYNYYEVVQAVQSLLTYTQEYIFPLLLGLVFLNFSVLTISILRWFKK